MQQTELTLALADHDDLRMVAGVDEVGRGPLAGDVVAAAVILDPDNRIAGLKDSKKLSPAKRESLFTEIREKALAFSLGRASVEEIDTLNILHASLLAMARAVTGLVPQPVFVYVDGNRCPPWHYSSQAVVDGENKVAAIAAASIVAKVTRDRELDLLDKEYPGYGLSQHKGYATREHLDALKKLGPCRIHRKSFAPVAEALRADALGQSQVPSD